MSLSPISVPYLLLQEKCKNSPEKTYRINRILEANVDVIIRSLLGDDVPFLDSIPSSGVDDICTSSERYDLVWHYMNRVRAQYDLKEIKDEIGSLKHYRYGTRLWITDLWLKGKREHDLKPMLKIMRERTDYYVIHGSYID
jgi:hypothetical protein